MKYCYLLMVLLYCSGCSPGYVLRAAYEEAKILANREDITELLSDSGTEQQEREKLAVVSAARQYAAEIGLTPGDAFTKYTRIDRPELAWVLMGSKKTAFELRTWWFPIVGTVPYKGFFDKEDAEIAAKKIESVGYETWLRPTDAFSTLGWFNDPILSTTLRRNEVDIANTVIHEIVHSTLWFPGHVEFNESLANFIAHQAAIGFWQEQLAGCTDDTCRQQKIKFLELAEKDYAAEFLLEELVAQLYQKLDQLYKSGSPEEVKLSERIKIFNDQVSSFRTAFPQAKVFRTINNAEIMQLKIYLTKLSCFKALFAQTGENWDVFLEELRAMAKETNNETSPFKLIAQKLNSESAALCN